jgi:hypothetical protein
LSVGEMSSIDVDAVDKGLSSVGIALEGFEVCGSEAVAYRFLPSSIFGPLPSS